MEKIKFSALSFLIFFLLSLSLVSAGTLRVTEEHPFLINNSWISASELKVGDLLTTVDGKKAIIKNIQDISVLDNESFLVYNLEAEEYSNFVVDGSLDGSEEGVVVHNSGRPWWYLGGKGGFAARLNSAFNWDDRSDMGQIYLKRFKNGVLVDDEEFIKITGGGGVDWKTFQKEFFGYGGVNTRDITKPMGAALIGVDRGGNIHWFKVDVHKGSAQVIPALYRTKFDKFYRVLLYSEDNLLKITNLEADAVTLEEADTIITYIGQIPSEIKMIGEFDHPPTGRFICRDKIASLFFKEKDSPLHLEIELPKTELNYVSPFSNFRCE
jgi:intein/homing endonuclease